MILPFLLASCRCKDRMNVLERSLVRLSRSYRKGISHSGPCTLFWLTASARAVAIAPSTFCCPDGAIDAVVACNPAEVPTSYLLNRVLCIWYRFCNCGMVISIKSRSMAACRSAGITGKFAGKGTGKVSSRGMSCARAASTVSRTVAIPRRIESHSTSLHA